MRPIALSRPLTLEASQTVADGAGGFRLAWQALGTLWAEVVAGTGREAAGEEDAGGEADEQGRDFSAIIQTLQG